MNLVFRVGLFDLSKEMGQRYLAPSSNCKSITASGFVVKGLDGGARQVE